MTADAIDLVRHSVTRADHPQNGVGVGGLGGVWNIMIGPTDALHSVPGLPPYWSRARDFDADPHAADGGHVGQRGV